MESVIENKVYIKFPAIPENERLARMLAASFLADFNPTVEETDDVKTAVSEAVTNCIIHAYKKEERAHKEVEMIFEKVNREFRVCIIDSGKGIKDIKQAMEPMFTTESKEERSGMGFSFMEAFMDEVEVVSSCNEGTKVMMKKRIGRQGE